MPILPLATGLLARAVAQFRETTIPNKLMPKNFSDLIFSTMRLTE